MKAVSILILAYFLSIFLVTAFSPLIFPNLGNTIIPESNAFTAIAVNKTYTSSVNTFSISLPSFPSVSIGDTIVLSYGISSPSGFINPASLPDSANWHRINGIIQSGHVSEMYYYVASTSGAFTASGNVTSLSFTGTFYLFNLGQNIQANHIVNETGSGGSGSASVSSFTAQSNGIIIGTVAYSGSTYTAGSGYTLFPIASGGFGISEYAYFPSFSTTTAPLTLSGSTSWSYTVVQFLKLPDVCTSFAGISTITSSSVYFTTDTFTTVLGGSTTVRTTTITTTFDATTQTTTQTTTSVSGGTTAFYTSAHTTTSFTTRTTTTVQISTSVASVTVTTTQTGIIAPDTNSFLYWFFEIVCLLVHL